MKYTRSWEQACIKLGQSIKDALASLNQSGALISCVVDDSGVLKGILTDSDIRRALLKGARMDSLVDEWMNTNPVVAKDFSTKGEILELLSSWSIREIPLIDSDGRVTDIFALGMHETKLPAHRPMAQKSEIEMVEGDASMLILAGGLGTRLRTAVSDRPKSLAEVGGTPILQTVIMQAVKQGVKKFFVSVNYLAEQIEAHLQQPLYRDIDVTVLKEPKKMGTAGSISMIADALKEPLIVANSDILTTASFARLLRVHKSQQSFLTCSVRPYVYRVPFGVCEVSNLRITSIVEKPEQTSLVNAGIYVLSPDAANMIPKNQYFDMTDLLKMGLDNGKVVTPFYLHEYWIDIGKPDDFERANAEFKHFFD